MQYKVLIVDDDEENRTSTQALLERWGYATEVAASGDEGIALLRDGLDEYAVILLDYKMPVKNGAETAKEIRTFNTESVILVYSAHRSEDNILLSVRAGSVDFIEKDENTDYLREAIDAACKKYEETARVLKPRLEKSAADDLLRSMNMVGRSSKTVDTVFLIQKARGSKKPVLITGETGTGKELIAKAIHGSAKTPYFSINCAAYDKAEFLSSDLFGHEKGAYTGAVNSKVGIFELARGGTVFLDEVHCLGMASQRQLLRAIREKKIKRMGSNKDEYSVDFNIIAATKPDIEERVKSGEFLADLYYRLKFVTINLSPLRERPEDIEPLILNFCQKYFEETGEKKTFRMKTVKMLERYEWPGNIGELEGYVYDLLRKSDRDTIEPKQLEAKFFNLEKASSPQSLPELQKSYETEKRNRIIAAVRTSESVAEAAQRLGVGRTTLHTLLTRLGMRDQVSLKT
jgi:DNA-binding NtrC family response regulator